MTTAFRKKIAPNMKQNRTIISKEERLRKRNKLHSIIQRIIQGPTFTDDGKSTEGDNCCSYTTRSISPPSTPASAEGDECQRLVRKKVERLPRRMSQLTVLPGMELVVPVKYNHKMARSFPETQQKSEREKTRRIKNSISARESRAKMRVMNDLLKSEAAETKKLNQKLKAGLASGMSYAMVLMEKLNLPQVDFLKMWPMAKATFDASFEKAEKLCNKTEQKSTVEHHIEEE